MRPANGFARRARLAAGATLLVAFAALAGCASPVQPVAPMPAPRLARVEVINLCECDWRVTIAAPTIREMHTLNVSAHETTRIDLAGGDYAITQTILPGLTGPESTRQFAAHFDAGETYRWRLATLLTASSGSAP